MSVRPRKPELSLVERASYRSQMYRYKALPGLCPRPELYEVKPFSICHLTFLICHFKSSDPLLMLTTESHVELDRAFMTTDH